MGGNQLRNGGEWISLDEALLGRWLHDLAHFDTRAEHFLSTGAVSAARRPLVARHHHEDYTSDESDQQQGSHDRHDDGHQLQVRSVLCRGNLRSNVQRKRMNGQFPVAWILGIVQHLPSRSSCDPGTLPNSCIWKKWLGWACPTVHHSRPCKMRRYDRRRLPVCRDLCDRSVFRSRRERRSGRWSFRVDLSSAHERTDRLGGTRRRPPRTGNLRSQCCYSRRWSCWYRRCTGRRSDKAFGRTRWYRSRTHRQKSLRCTRKCSPGWTNKVRYQKRHRYYRGSSIIYRFEGHSVTVGLIAARF